MATFEPTFKPNFFSTYSVILDHPLTTVFPILATAEGHERVCRLSSLCTQFELLERDIISLPAQVPLSEAYVRTVAASTAVAPADDGARQLPRQAFTMQETVPILFGIFHSVVSLSGTLTWDEAAHVALYETTASQGIAVWKLRSFEALDGNKTQVSERIVGGCPGWLKVIVQKEAAKAHMTHMNLYHTLF